MKKRYRVLSMVLALSLVLSVFTGTLAFAEETGPSVISLNDFGSAETIEKYGRMIYEIEVDQPEVKLEAASSDEDILKTYLEEDSENPGYYALVVEGWEEGEADVTITAADGTTAGRTITVRDTGYEWDYTAEADLSEDFTIPSGNSRYIKIHYENNSGDYYSFPTLVSDNQDDFAVTPVGEDGSDFYYRVDAKGGDGKTGKLYIGSSDYVVPEELCSVTIRENSDLRIDTKSSYVCSVYDSYRFVVYTKSDEEPEVKAYNDVVSVTSVDKVDGGYEYEMTAEEEGESLVQATLNGETSAFAVTVNYDDPPSFVSDTADEITVEQGKTYTYHFSIMGGGAPSFAADAAGAFTVQSVKKDGISYSCTVLADGEVGSSASLLVSFPESSDEFTVNAGKVTVAEPTGTVMKSDTNDDFSLSRGSSYVFKITGAKDFYAGTSGVFAVSKVGTSGDGTLYRITAVGKPGQASGVYMSDGQTAKKVCVVTVAPVSITSDTNSDFSLAKGTSYQFKITAPGLASIKFSAGTSGVVTPVLVGHSGSDFYYRVTAVGKAGAQTGIYVSDGVQDPKKLCVVTVGKIKVTSDTNSDFSLAKGASYQFKITAPGAASVSLTAGTGGVVQTALVKKVGGDFYLKVTATGKAGAQTGLYVSVPDQEGSKLCVVTVK